MIRLKLKSFHLNFYQKFLLLLIALAVIPQILLSWFTLAQVKQSIQQTVHDSSDKMLNDVLKLQQENLLNQTRLMDKEMSVIQDSVRTLQHQAQDIFRYRKSFRPLTGAFKLHQEQAGFQWEPVSPQLPASNVGISSQAPLTKELKADLILTKHLEPLLINLSAQNHDLVAMYIVLKESAWRIYPALNMPEEIAAGNMRPDFKVQEYSFFYSADPSNNPERKVVWTKPYLDITRNGWMTSAVAPVYLADGTFRGVIGADYTIDKMVNGVLNINFDEPGAYAFLVDDSGRLVALPAKGKTDFTINGATPLPGTPLDKLDNQDLRRAIQAVSLNYRQEPLLNIGGAKKYLLTAPLKATNWHLAFLIPAQEITNPITFSAQTQIKEAKVFITSRLLAWDGFLVWLTLTAAFVLAHSFDIPIYQLTAGARAISQGQIGIQIPELGHDELATLARTFNSMSRKIADLLADQQAKALEQADLNERLVEINWYLEQRVKERTAELAATNTNLEAVNKRLQSMEDSRCQLLANISHDLKTPITLIQGYVEALQDGIATQSGDRENYLKIIHNKTLELNCLINDLFELSRLESSQFPMNFIPISATEAITLAVEKVTPDIVRAGLEFHTEISPALPAVFIDPDRLDRVFTNLVMNALNHTPAGGTITLRATLLSSSDTDQILVEIKDNGQGIPQEHLHNIFTRFYRVDKSRRKTGAGSGLGLTIAREIITAHGGMIWAESIPEQGSSFFFTLPIFSDLPGPHRLIFQGSS